MVRAKALETPETLVQACSSAMVPDRQMPEFDIKVDPNNLMDMLPTTSSRPSRALLLRASFMNTEWLALSVTGVSKERCLRFCLCAAALQNTGKQSSRSVTIEVCGGQELGAPGFACTPMSTYKTPREQRDRDRDRAAPASQTWLERADEIGELADIVTNEALSSRKLRQELWRWAKRQATNTAGSETRERSSSWSLGRNRSASFSTGEQYAVMASSASLPEEPQHLTALFGSLGKSFKGVFGGSSSSSTTEYVSSESGFDNMVSPCASG